MNWDNGGKWDANSGSFVEKHHALVRSAGVESNVTPCLFLWTQTSSQCWKLEVWGWGTSTDGSGQRSLAGSLLGKEGLGLPSKALKPIGRFIPCDPGHWELELQHVNFRGKQTFGPWQRSSSLHCSCLVFQVRSMVKGIFSKQFNFSVELIMSDGGGDLFLWKIQTWKLFIFK